MSEKDDLIYDEEESVKFIQNYLPQEYKGRFSEEDIYYIVDLIYEYYDKMGYFKDEVDDNEEEVVDIDEDALIEFVIKNCKKDNVGKFEPEEITFIVQGELAYCESINMFD